MRAAEAREAFYEGAFGRPNYEERREGKPLAKEAMSGYFKITRGKPSALNAFDKDVLEVDCGLGMRLRAFQDYGWWVMGTETSATAFEYARRQSLDVRRGPLTGMFDDGPPRPAGSSVAIRFHLVFFCGSFGRVARPRGVAEKLREIIAPEGLVCVLREPLACRGAKLAQDPSQLILYTADSLRPVFCERGFSLVSEEFPPGGGVAEGTGTFWFRTKARK